MQDKIYDILTKEDEITWQSIIYELVKSEQLDPWNIDLTLLANRYLETIKQLKDHNFHISGKVLLASAILLRLKSYKLVHEHIAALDSQLFPPEEELLEDMEQEMFQQQYPHLLVKTPQPRRRQITIKELITALEKALEVDERRRVKRVSQLRVIREAVMPQKVIDISLLMNNVYEKIKAWFKTKPSLTFSELVNSPAREDKIATFIPLLHLAHKQKVDVDQQVAFGEIDIRLLK